jgi:prophage maintenance system killer protein
MAGDPYHPSHEPSSQILPGSRGSGSALHGAAGGPYFPSADDVVEVNRLIHARSGQPESFGIEDAGHLSRVLEHARLALVSAPPEPSEVLVAAGRLAYGLASHGPQFIQAFRDGNRRTAFWITRQFLDAHALGYLSAGDREDEMFSRYLNGVVEGAHMGKYLFTEARFIDLFTRRYQNRTAPSSQA